MSQVTQKLITAEEFMNLPQPADGSRQELVRGGIVTMPPPKARHEACCVKMVCRVGSFVEVQKLGTVLCNDDPFGTAIGYRKSLMAMWKSRRTLPSKSSLPAITTPESRARSINT